MMNQPLRRVDPLARSAPSAPHRSIDAHIECSTSGSVWPISCGSRQAIVDNGQRFDYATLKALAKPDKPAVPDLAVLEPDLAVYDQLLAGGAQ